MEPEEVGIKHRFIYGSFDDPKEIERIVSYCRASHEKNILNLSTIGAFGGRGMGQTCGVADPSQWMRTFGVDIDTRDTTELLSTARDEIGISLLDSDDGLTTPENAESYYQKTGVDIIVANLGTEHRTSATSLKYHERLAWDITKKIGPRLCLHGTSSVSMEKLTRLFDDGICKVNIWTTLERDSTPTLIKNILNNVSKMVDREKVNDWVNNQLLSKLIDQSSTPSVDYFTTTYRQDIIFSRMKEIISSYLNLWYK